MRTPLIDYGASFQRI
jgi:vesicle-fusing ATPase